MGKEIGRSTESDVDAFVAALRAAPSKASATRGRLVFALDATASRDATWDRASALHADMFQEATIHGGLSVQLCHFHGFGEFHATPWLDEPKSLLRHMSETRCAAGVTQIEKLLRHVRVQCRGQPVGALVFVGDAFEESLDPVADAAGQLALVGCPVFMFQEGSDAQTARAFRTVARLSGGAWCRFDSASAAQLRELLRAVAAFVSGGRAALQALEGRDGTLTRQLTHQLHRK
ncbi:MAG: VWA domain-containing protein [Chromatiales bacterium]|jgi:hypothetical protein|nr:VWA domain-containing protein [Chromatiales bacterium]